MLELACSYSRQIKTGRRHRMPLKSVDNNSPLPGSLPEPPKCGVPFRHEPFTDHYTVEGDIGRGKFAVVRLCRHKLTGDVFAAKFLRRRRGGQDCRRVALHEISVLEKCRHHHNIVHITEVFESAREIIIVTEYAGGGDLMQYVEEQGALSESVIVHSLRHIITALDFLHDLSLVHLDLKPQNVVLSGPACTDVRVMVCDLGVVRDISEREVRDIVGTPQYVAPEVLSYEPIHTGTDMWSVGVLTYELLTGYSPFGGDTKQEIYCNISQLDVDYSLITSQPAASFISKLLQANPSDRLTAKQALSHPWLNPDMPAPPPPVVSSPGGHRRTLSSPSPSSEPLKRCRCDSPDTTDTAAPEDPTETPSNTDTGTTGTVSTEDETTSETPPTKAETSFISLEVLDFNENKAECTEVETSCGELLVLTDGQVALTSANSSQA